MSTNSGQNRSEHTDAANRPELTADESADLKMALKRDRVTDELRALSHLHPLEASEAVWEVERGFDTAASGSWVSGVLA